MTRSTAPQSARSFAAARRERERAAIRLYARLFRHWRDCRLPGCRRARACRGEQVACFRRWWRALAEAEREAGRTVLRKVVEARLTQERGGQMAIGL